MIHHHHHPPAHVDPIGSHDVDGAVPVITNHNHDHGNHVHQCAHHYDDRYHYREDDSSDETWSSGIPDDFYIEETEYGSDDNAGMQQLGQPEQSHGNCGLRMHLQSEGAEIATAAVDSVEMEMPQSESTSNDGDDEGGEGECEGSGTRSRSRSSSGASCWPRPIGNKPHKAQDAEWAAIRSVISSESAIGLHHFRFLQRLGSGDIGTVYLTELLKVEEGLLGTRTSDIGTGTGTGTGFYYAMKIVDKRALAKRNKLHRARTEREILEILDHPFLPTLYAHIDDGRQSCLVMEFCPGGDLHVLRQLQPGKRFSGSAVRFYAVEVLLALEYLHMMGVVYRDLKPENVLVREDGHIMLSDFDLSLKCNVDPAIATTSIVRGNSFVRRVGARPDNGWTSTPPHVHGANFGLCSSTGGRPTSCIDTPLRCGVVSSCSIHPITSCLPIRNCLVPYFVGCHPRRRHHAQPQHLIKTNTNSSRNNAPELLAEPTSVRSMSFVGTHEYLAPEIILGEGHGAAVDRWTLGIFLYELLHGRTPFKGPDNETTLTNVVTQLLKFPTLGASTAADDILAQYSTNLQGDTSYMEAQDLIKRLLVKDPRKRIGAVKGATEIKQHPFFRGVNWALVRCATPPEIPLPFSLGTNHNVSNGSPSLLGVSNDDNGGGAASEFKLF